MKARSYEASLDAEAELSAARRGDKCALSSCSSPTLLSLKLGAENDARIRRSVLSMLPLWRGMFCSPSLSGAPGAVDISICQGFETPNMNRGRIIWGLDAATLSLRLRLRRVGEVVAPGAWVVRPSAVSQSTVENFP